MADLYEFIQCVQDDVAYLPIPRQVLRDNSNPLEVYTNNELYQRYRFCRDTIQTVLLPMVYPINNRESNRGLPIPPIIKLCMALRFYATGSYQRTIEDLMAISQATACRIINEVSEIIARQLPRYIKFPERDIAQNRNRFYEIAHFPGVIGCIDGTHIEICSPGGPTAETFRNRKGWMSLNVQVVCGPNHFNRATRAASSVSIADPLCCPFLKTELLVASIKQRMETNKFYIHRKDEV